MKICFVTEDIFTLGGIQRVVSRISSELSNNYEVEIICLSKKSKIDRSLYNLSNKVKVTFYENVYQKSVYQKILPKIIMEINNETGFFNKKVFCNLLANAYYPIHIQKRIIEIFKKNKYDIVIGVGGYYSLLLGIIADDISAKLIGWQHNSFDAYLNNPRKYCWKQNELFKKYLPRLERVIVLTDADRIKYIEEIKLKQNCITIYNPLSFESKEKSSCKNKNIIFVGRLLREQKGLDFLIDVYKKVREQRNEWRLSIVGDGPDKDSLIAMIEKNNLKDFIDIYPYTNEISNYYIDSSLLVSTSRWEGFGLVITEAMECGIPVIAFNNSGPREIIRNNETGILIDKYDIDKMVSSILFLIDNYDIRSEMGKKSAVRANNFNISTVIKKWDNCLREVL